MKKKVHIISHSHWDREWYLPYEKHHMLLVELMDDVLELFETDPEFKSFYLDGQTIVLDDYLEVRPEKEALVRKHIDNGKLKVGPFYILPDAFLTSSESNVRNMLIGHRESLKWGPKTEIGYYPDTFGNVGQTPQLMKQLGFKYAAYGRGVKPTGFANQSNEEDNFVSSYSEMNWQGADGSEILGLLFANWYSNGNEIPAEKDAALAFWKQKLQDVEQYASTNHLLMMNGCDHQPVQKDLSAAIRLANELYPDYEFVHSDFPTYFDEMLAALPDDLDTVRGELTSQETEGWYTLTNTASARTYLKQKNQEVAQMLEQIAEPLATMAYEVTGEYPHDQLDYAWKLYMQNHAHDSICGCSVDEVHAENMTRFQKALSVGEYVADEALQNLAAHIDTLLTAKVAGHADAVPFVVFNTTGQAKDGLANIGLDVDKVYFLELFPTESYKQFQAEAEHYYQVVNQKGELVEAEVAVVGPKYGYELPKDAFRRPYIARRVEVSLPVKEMPSFSWETYFLVPSEAPQSTIDKAKAQDLTLENDYLKVIVEPNGTLTVTDLVNDQTYENLLVFEDTGDIGNEYVYKQPNGETAILSVNHLVDAFVSHVNDFTKELTLVHEIQVPLSADERLAIEQEAIIEFRNRQAQRVTETKPLRIETTVRLNRDSQQLEFNSALTNEMKDHRLRVLFPTGLQSSVNYSDSIFETVERPNEVSAAWTNPTNPQRLRHFVNVRDEKVGVVVAPEGLHEYEIIAENNQQTIAITLMRAVGELGDWGYFPTPEAQCLNRYQFSYRLSFHGSSEASIQSAYRTAIASAVPFTTTQATLHAGRLPKQQQYLAVEGEAIVVTALKRNSDNNLPVTRFYNFTSDSAPYALNISGYQAFESNILEERLSTQSVTASTTAQAFEIVTHIWDKK